METAEAAFGIYSTKLEGDEESRPGIKSDHWVGPGQGGLVKSKYMVNILAPECSIREIGEFAAALEPKIPGSGTVRPKGMAWLPRAGMVAGSWRFIKARSPPRTSRLSRRKFLGIWRWRWAGRGSGLFG